MDKAEIKKRKKLYREAHKAEISSYNRAYRIAHGQDPGVRRRPYMKGKEEYALYIGDELMGFGTRYELAERFGVSPERIQWCSTPSGMRQVQQKGGTGMVTVRLDCDDEGEDE